MTQREKLTRRLAIITAVGMFIVLLLGARVTATGSGEGCGRDWPLCHGTWLPQNTYESITEYTHRIVTGIEGFLVLATSILAWPLRRKFPEIRIFVPVMAGTLILQSLMGAAAVKWPQSPKIMAVHFGISMVCLAATALLARVINEEREDSRNVRDTTRDIITSGVPAFRAVAIVTTLFAILTAYTGAYVRHTGAELACTSWPTCNGKLIPEFDGLQGIHTIHRLFALGISLLIGLLFLRSLAVRSERPDLFRASVQCLTLVLVQSLIGLLVVETGVQNLLVTLLHAAGMSIIFVILCDTVRLCYPRPVSESLLASHAHVSSAHRPEGSGTVRA